MVRKLSKLWRDKCNIYGFEKVKDEKTNFYNNLNFSRNK